MRKGGRIDGPMPWSKQAGTASERQEVEKLALDSNLNNISTVAEKKQSIWALMLAGI